MKFSEMPYERPDLEALIRDMADLTERLKTPRTIKRRGRSFREGSVYEARRHAFHAGERAPYH